MKIIENVVNINLMFSLLKVANPGQMNIRLGRLEPWCIRQKQSLLNWLRSEIFHSIVAIQELGKINANR